VQRLFANPDFSFGTRLSRPLNARINSYILSRTQRSKPALIVVITDGVPAPRDEPRQVAQSLIGASHRTAPGEVTVVFFQIGGADRFGRVFLNHMDNFLVSNGARHDLVRTVSFEELQNRGLTRSLVSAVSEFAVQARR
jgi:hypothetical protein